MTVFVGIKVEPELPRLTVSQLHGNSICRYRGMNISGQMVWVLVVQSWQLPRDN
jgi:hypothetical protein